MLYSTGRVFWSKKNADGMKKAIELFGRAINIDPNYALAYSGLADCYRLADDVRRSCSEITLAELRTKLLLEQNKSGVKMPHLTAQKRLSTASRPRRIGWFHIEDRHPESWILYGDSSFPFDERIRTTHRNRSCWRFLIFNWCHHILRLSELMPSWAEGSVV